MYVGGLLNNVEQHANIDHNNDVDNHVNPGLATVPRYNFVNIRKILQYTCGNLSLPSKDTAITLLYINFDNNFTM